MGTHETILWVLFIAAAVVSVVHLWLARRRTEPFITIGGSVPGPSLMDMSTRALDSAPTTSEAKNFYKQLLVFADSDIRQQGTQGLRLLADFRDRVYGPRDFRGNLTADDFLGNWPSWLPPLDTTIQEPAPSVDDAVTAEVRVLAYLQKNFPQEDLVDEDTGSTIRNIIEDFGYRFVFIKGEETAALRPDFLRQPLLQNWVNPTSRA
jgi:hypothetical protein